MLVRILAATVAGGVVFFVVGYILFAVLLESFFKGNMIQYPGLMKEPMPDMIFLVLWNLAMAFLFAFVFERWAGIRTFVGGLQGGAILMFISVLITNLPNLAFMNVYKGYAGFIVNVVVSTALGTLAAGVVGLVLGLMNKNAAAA